MSSNTKKINELKNYREILINIINNQNKRIIHSNDQNQHSDQPKVLVLKKKFNGKYLKVGYNSID